MVMEMTSLKAVEEPMLMRPRRQAMLVLTAMEKRGIDVRGSTWTGRRQYTPSCSSLGQGRVSEIEGRGPTYLAQILPAWETAVPSECPSHPRRRGQESNRRTYTQDGHDRGHHRTAPNGTGGLHENVHERVTSRTVQDGVDVSDAEQHRDKHAEAQGSVDQNAGDHGAWHNG